MFIQTSTGGAMAVSVDTRSTLRRYSGGLITVVCRHCDHRAEMPFADLAEQIGWDVEIERPRRFRLKCSSCGNKAPALTVSLPYPHGASKSRAPA